MRQLVRLAGDAQGRGEAKKRVARYVGLARRIGMRYQVSLPRDLRRLVCRACDAVLVPGATARHRVNAGRVTVTCLACGTVKRYPFRPARRTVA